MSIFLSIIIPVYNAAKYLSDTLRSLSLQDDWEVILIDDGSSDDSLKICRQYAENSLNVKVLSQPNGGPGKARNFGLEYAAGEYITFLDADDGFESGSLETACEYLKKNPIDLLLQQIERQNLSGESFFTVKYQNTKMISHSDLMTLWCNNDSGIRGYLCGKIYHKSLLKDIKIPENMRFAEDMYVLSDIFLKTKTVCMFSEGAYIYYERENTPTTGEWNIRKSRQLLKAYLHRWECAVQAKFPLNDQISAWGSALALFVAERKTFPAEDWNIERSSLKENNYSLFSCLKTASGFRRKLGLLRNIINL